MFLSSSMFTSNVMVEVATKKAKNPVAVVAEKINMHSFAESQPALALPGKIIIPRYAWWQVPAVVPAINTCVYI